jgi:hypothetical protein
MKGMELPRARRMASGCGRKGIEDAESAADRSACGAEAPECGRRARTRNRCVGGFREQEPASGSWPALRASSAPDAIPMRLRRSETTGEKYAYKKTHLHLSLRTRRTRSTPGAARMSRFACAMPLRGAGWPAPEPARSRSGPIPASGKEFSHRATEQQREALISVALLLCERKPFADSGITRRRMNRCRWYPPPRPRGMGPGRRRRRGSR